MEPLRDARRMLDDWWGLHRARLTLLLIAAVALGGIVCMALTVIAIIVGQN